MGQIGFGLVMLDLGLKESYNVLLIVIQTMSWISYWFFKEVTQKYLEVLISILPYLQVYLYGICNWVSQSVNDYPTYRTPPLALARDKPKKMLQMQNWQQAKRIKNCPHIFHLWTFLCWTHVKIRCQIMQWHQTAKKILEHEKLAIFICKLFRFETIWWENVYQNAK